MIHCMKDKSRRVTVYFEPAVHRALRLKAAETDRSVSDLVNDAVRRALAQDAEDLAAFEERAGEPSLSFEDVLKNMKRRGQL
jgi:plasmid stability protein